MAERSQEIDVDERRQSENEKAITIPQTVQELEHLAKKIQLQIENRDNEIRYLKNELRKKQNFSCGSVFHSYVTYKGTDVIAPCNCRKDYTSLIPNELVVEIFHYLPQEFLDVCAKVCTRWKEISSDKSLWRKVKLKGGVINMIEIDRFIALGAKKLVLSHMQILHHRLNADDAVLDQTVSSDQSEIINRHRHDKCNDLMEFEMHNFRKLDTSILNEILWKCIGVESLTLSRMSFNSEIYNTIAQFKNITSLKLKFVNLDSKGLNMVLESCENVTTLDLSQTGDWLHELPSYFPPNLTNLVLSEVFYEKGSNEKFKEIIQKCPNLTSLNIDICDGLSQISIYYISQYLQKLQFLSIRENIRLYYNLSPLKNISSLQEIFWTGEQDDIDPVIQNTLRNVRLSFVNFEDNAF